MHSRIRAPYLTPAFAVCSLFVLGPFVASPAQAQTFAGRAFAASVTTGVPGAGTTYFADTGALPSDGGWQPADVAGTQTPALSADVLNASTSGATYLNLGDQVFSSASLADIVVLPGSAAQLTAQFARSEAKTTADQLRGSTQVASLVFGGVPVVVTGDPNQTVEIPGVARLVINEQVVTAAGSLREITVNALHLTVTGGAEVILSSAYSSINSGP